MSTAKSWKEMMLKQKANAVANGNTAKVTQINALLAANGVVVEPAPAAAAPPAPESAPRNLNLSNFTPAEVAHLNAVAAYMRPKPKTDLEISYSALKKAESAGKKRSRRTRRRHRTRSRK
jgi:hypothetical protein